MSRIVLRTRRTLDDLPPIASDDDLVEWGQQLIAQPARPRVRRSEPLRAARTPHAAHTEATSPTMTIDEVFDDIATRAAAVHRPTRLRRITLA